MAGLEDRSLLLLLPLRDDSEEPELTTDVAAARPILPSGGRLRSGTGKRTLFLLFCSPMVTIIMSLDLQRCVLSIGW